jgi:hypothetical protein
MQEKENVLRILEETKYAMTKEDSVKLKELSNQTIHTASTTQDHDNIAVAVIVYSLSKIIERKQYQGFAGWNNFYNEIVSAIDASINSIKRNEEPKLHESLAKITKTVSKLSGKFKIYIQDVFRKAQINKASKIYEHGISMEQTANLLGITLFELASYSGQRPEISDVSINKTIDVKKRVKLAMEMFQ